MTKKKSVKEEEVKTLSEVEEALLKKDEELISDENVASMEAPSEPVNPEEIKSAFKETEMQEEIPDDGLDHIEPEKLQESISEPIKELLDETKEIQIEETELINSLKDLTPENAEKEINTKISKVESFKKKLQESFKGKTNYQIIHSWNGASYPF